MAALKPFARCALILATTSVPAFGGVLGQDQAAPGRPTPGKTIVSTPSEPAADAEPGRETTSTTPETARPNSEPSVFPSSNLRNLRSPYRPLGIAPPSDQPGAGTATTTAEPSAPASKPPLTLGTTSEQAPPAPAKPDAPASGGTKVETNAPAPSSSTPPASSVATPAQAPTPPSSIYSTPTASGSSTSFPSGSGSSPASSSGSGAFPGGLTPSSSAGSSSSPPAPIASGLTGSGSAAPTLATSSSSSSTSSSSAPIVTPPYSSLGSTSTIGAGSSTPVRASTATPPAGAPTAVADAYINFGTGPYADAGKLIVGDPKPWYESPSVTKLFGGTAPDAKAQASFETKVVSTVEDTYKQSGVPVRLTTDASAPSAHSMSVVSGAQAADNPGAIGIASVGYNGFTFIDKFTQARTADALATAVGNNLAHEMMHAFGVADHFNEADGHVDAATTTWTTLTDPAASFSQPAANLLSTLDFQATGEVIAASASGIGGQQNLVDGDPAATAAVVPEPSTVALWALAGTAALVLRRRRA